MNVDHKALADSGQEMTGHGGVPQEIAKQVQEAQVPAIAWGMLGYTLQLPEIYLGMLNDLAQHLNDMGVHLQQTGQAMSDTAKSYQETEQQIARMFQQLMSETGSAGQGSGDSGAGDSGGAADQPDPRA